MAHRADHFVVSFAAAEHRVYTARFHEDLLAAVRRRTGRPVTADLCRGGQGDANRASVAAADVLVALCSPSYYRDAGCGTDRAVFEHRLQLVPAQWRPEVPPSRVLVRWKPADAPRGIPGTPVMIGEITDAYATRGLYEIVRDGPNSAAYRQAVDVLAGAVATGLDCPAPAVALGELPDLAPAFPRPRTPRGKGAKWVPAPRTPLDGDRPPHVFLSYADVKKVDDGFHQGRVRALHDALAREGIDVHWDVKAAESGPKYWARWMRRQVKIADFVVVVVSPTYKRRAEHEEVAGQGDGVAFEADLILNKRLVNRDWFERILLVVLPEHSKADVPDFLEGVTLYTLDPETGEGDLPLLVKHIKARPSGTGDGSTGPA